MSRNRSMALAEKMCAHIRSSSDRHAAADRVGESAEDARLRRAVEILKVLPEAHRLEAREAIDWEARKMNLRDEDVKENAYIRLIAQDFQPGKPSLTGGPLRQRARWRLLEALGAERSRELRERAAREGWLLDDLDDDLTVEASAIIALQRLEWRLGMISFKDERHPEAMMMHAMRVKVSKIARLFAVNRGTPRRWVEGVKRKLQIADMAIGELDEETRKIVELRIRTGWRDAKIATHANFEQEEVRRRWRYAVELINMRINGRYMGH